MKKKLTKNKKNEAQQKHVFDYMNEFRFWFDFGRSRSLTVPVLLIRFVRCVCMLQSSDEHLSRSRVLTLQPSKLVCGCRVFSRDTKPALACVCAQSVHNRRAQE